MDMFMAGPPQAMHRRAAKWWPGASTSGGMFVQSEKFVEEHGGRIGDFAVYGQESIIKINTGVLNLAQ